MVYDSKGLTDDSLRGSEHFLLRCVGDNPEINILPEDLSLQERAALERAQGYTPERPAFRVAPPRRATSPNSAQAGVGAETVTPKLTADVTSEGGATPEGEPVPEYISIGGVRYRAESIDSDTPSQGTVRPSLDVHSMNVERNPNLPPTNAGDVQGTPTVNEGRANDI